ncbi:hypothetical protein J4N45_10865 [Vibrio sp. SCSIO 43140]|uniref:hypothetical protein n=1 Tax=Vibrio sp. SCSIO 43140 TaxID=2819100 RepID=UPI00207630D8|nr:hypothetical protein [Vibrio sp. SCSIO 43140]USD59031.1 hypothetical protein J4N45_10865 [Vibrio sp. SCSIO 43140]
MLLHQTTAQHLQTQRLIDKPFDAFDQDVINHLDAQNISDFSFEAMMAYLNAEYAEACKAASSDLTFRQWSQANELYVNTIHVYFVYNNIVATDHMNAQEEVRVLH